MEMIGVEGEGGDWNADEKSYETLSVVKKAEAMENDQKRR